jgi:hypothetical protein
MQVVQFSVDNRANGCLGQTGANGFGSIGCGGAGLKF